MPKKRKTYSHRLICFDIETTHFKDDFDRDNLITWHWQAMTQDGPDDEPIYYTWTSWPACLAGLLDLCEGKPSICFVHNLSYETEAIIRNLGEHEISEVFATDTHKMLKFTLDGLLEFRCSYYLTNKSLALCGKDVGLEKLEMDYQKERYPGEDLTPKEESYCRRDVEIMIKKIRQLENQEGMSFWEFPLTNTAFLRVECRKEMRKNPENRKWFKRMRMNADEYLLSKDAFSGGYTHANYLYVGKPVPGVDSFDFGSAYPFAMLVHKYPSGGWHWVKPEKVTWKDISFILRPDSDLCFIGEFTFTNPGGKVVSKTSNTYLSASKCDTRRWIEDEHGNRRIVDDVILDNGRVQSATQINAVLTNLDFQLIMETYTVKAVKVKRFMWAKTGYLPDELLHCMLKYYERKQNLKGVEGEEDNYMKAKNRVNSFYGMMVTALLHDAIELNDTEWKRVFLDYADKNAINEQLNTYYNSYNSFLPYQVGIFVPNYTRFHLWHDIIIPNDKRVVYCDTDSAKVVDMEKCLPSIAKYNDWARGVRQGRLKMLGYENDFPDLGIFDHETADGAYQGFCTWGAKKYLVKDHTGVFKMTVAGLSKKAVSVISDWTDFIPGTIFGPDVSGRTVSRYVDNPENQWGDGGGCWIENTTYRLSVSDSFEILLSERDGLTLEEWEEQNSDLYLTKTERYHLARPERENFNIDLDIIKEKRNLYKVKL